ncbi:MAG: hypothetical protein CFH06_01220, partial [Alphaproteobacteria bacterium MarineAlpha3_Bin5]
RLILASSFARIFFRNCYNIGLPALICEQSPTINMGDKLIVDLDLGIIKNLTQDVSLSYEPIPEHLYNMVLSGGLLPYLKKQLSNEHN